MAKTKIVTDPNEEVPTEVMATAIRDIAEGTRKMLGGRLNKRAVLVLLKDATHESLETIERVLSAAGNLDKSYLKLALLALVLGSSACAPRVVNCNREAQWWATDGAGKISTQIKVCFRDDGSLAYRAEPFVPQAAKPDPMDEVKKIEADLRAEIDAMRAPKAAPEPAKPVVSDEAMAAKKAAAAKLK